MDPPAILDPIITSLANYYQIPKCLEPLDPDSDKKGRGNISELFLNLRMQSLTTVGLLSI